MTDEELIAYYADLVAEVDAGAVLGARSVAVHANSMVRLIALARRGAAVQWRPIKQAPRDNWGDVPQVLARDADGNVFLAFYYPPPHGDKYCKSSVDPTPAVEFIPLAALEQKP